MYSLIKNVLNSDDSFMQLDIATHIPLKMIFRDKLKLNDKEKKYVDNILTHVDFIIFYKCGKVPCLAIEVDGISFHKEGTHQAQRDKLKDDIFEKYELPLIRFKTNESNEREILISKLNALIN